MKKIKRSIISVLILSMLMSCIPEGIGMSLPVYASTFGDFDYDLDGAGKATIKGYYGPGGNVEIPETLDTIN